MNPDGGQFIYRHKSSTISLTRSGEKLENLPDIYANRLNVSNEGIAMTRQNNSGLPASRSMTQRSLLLSLGLASSISLLGGSLAYAEGGVDGEAIAVPSAEELLSAPAPAAPARASAPAPEPAAAPVERPARRVERPAARPAAEAPARPAPEAEVPARPAPTAEAPVRPAPAASSAPQPDAPVVEANPAAPVRPNVDYSELYIDPTNYGVGATERDHPTVVLTERSSGCETALQPGQGVSGVCRAIQTRMAQQSQGAGAGASAGSAGPRTVGGTRAVAAAGHSGGGGRGFALTPASVQNFYNRTIRPLAFLGNGNTSLLYPLSIPATITSAFGWRIHPISGTQRFHAGTDIGAPQGTPVLAAFSGRVNSADWMGGYGLAVVLTHSEGRTQTLYGHLSEIFVQPGQVVQQGDVIGRVGSTGNSTGPHLHFEYREYTSQGWVAMDAGQLLQGAMAQVINGFQIAKLPAPQMVNFDLTADVKDLADFGKLASDVLPEVAVASEKTLTSVAAVPTKETASAAKSEDDLPEVVVPAVVKR
ncbi:M23 family metallopeptidase [Leptolyngbya sp. PL-A3]